MSQQKQKQTTLQDTVAAAPHELTDQELDEVSGGIIIVSGKVASPTFAVRSFSFSFS